ncbi:hypothetical protein GF338_02730 [candidate division WOR-3 bacterium]|nr:hypothetical protein [candidate division WOR-3 bacterium]
MLKRVILVLSILTVFASARNVDKLLNKLARDVARRVEGNKKIVCWEIVPMDDDIPTSMGRYLALGLTSRLGDRLPGQVIDPFEGERSIGRELEYRLQYPTPSEIFKQFQGDYSMSGRYTILPETRQLKVYIEIFDKLTATIAGTASETVKLEPGEFKEFDDLDKRRPPSDLSAEASKFLTSSGTTASLINSARLMDGDGKEPITDKLKIGDFFKVEVDLKEQAYLYIVGLDIPSKGFYLVYPGSLEQINLLSGRICIPGAEGTAFRTVDYGGFNWFKVIATRKKVEWESFTSTTGGVQWLKPDELMQFIGNLNAQSGGWQAVLTEVWIE